MLILLIALAVLVSLVVVTLALAVREKQRVQDLQRPLLDLPAGTATFDTDSMGSLPPTAQRYLLHAIAPGTTLPARVTMKMDGHIRLARNGVWIPFRATAVLAPPHGFVWAATASPGDPRMMAGADWLVNGAAGTRFSWLGAWPLVNARSEDVAKSAAGRLAIEAALLPGVLAPGGALDAAWSEVDERVVRCAFRIHDMDHELSLTIAEDGRLEQASLQRWGDFESSDGSFRFLPFVGRFEREATFDGFTIPEVGAVAWQPEPDNEFEFFRFTVREVTFDGSAG